MIRSKFFSRFIVVTLTAALLLVMGGRAITVSALADPVQSISPVFDTQIYQLSDYVDALPEPSVDIFYILTGVLFVSQLGAEKYKLIDPYATKDGVINWFKSMGVRAYNTLIGLAPSVDPVLGFDVRPYIKPLVAGMMGNAVMAANYSSVEEFMESEDQVLVPFKKDIQQSINYIWQLQGGPYHWQFDTQPFTSNVLYEVASVSQINQYEYNTFVESMTQPRVRMNSTSSTFKNHVMTSTVFETYHNIFINTSENKVYFVSDSGQPASGYIPATSEAHFEQVGNSWILRTNQWSDCFPYFFNNFTYNPNAYDTYEELVQKLYDGIIRTDETFMIYYQDFIQHVYVGTNWLNKQELSNVHHLNYDDGGDPFYEEVQDDDVFIDIKNLIDDLVDQTDIWNKIILNITNPDGTIRIPNFIRVSVDLTPITELLDPPIPVNLNEIAELTDNSYLERVKEESKNASYSLAYLVAFWHNCDAELIYVLFGAGITVLIGAFIGKWGHS